MSRPEGAALLGVAVLCAADGTVRRVLRDDFGLTGNDRVKTFHDLLDEGSRDKADRFLETIRAEEVALGWELIVDGPEGWRELHFAGGSLDPSVLIIGAGSEQGALGLYEELMRVSNDQANLLREVSRERYTGSDDEAGLDHLAELTRVNNELTNLQRELARKNAELERLNTEKNRFLGMAAHDLRNPLGAIQMMAEFLRDQEELELDERQAEFLDSIVSSSTFMLQLVDDLLDISRIEAGAVELELERTDLLGLVRQNVRLNQTLAGRKETEIVLEAPDGPVHAAVDPGKIEQVTSNLISNAVKYSPGGSTVTVSLEVDGPDVWIRVADEGPGIPEDEREELFRPFGSTSVQATGGEQSTGLGLVITKQIVDAHEGEITVDSTEGEGSTFGVRLPRKEGAPAD